MTLQVPSTEELLQKQQDFLVRTNLLHRQLLALIAEVSATVTPDQDNDIQMIYNDQDRRQWANQARVTLETGLMQLTKAINPTALYGYGTLPTNYLRPNSRPVKIPDNMP